ncbi:uncharacterized protein LOC142322757 [Lycorma delicatula]|uniref:uncharacterized protein LOC142322757 n=1 Tax=Lycorma delicatula TaxID=130591 RepID=UPI003F50FD8F
MFVQISVAGVVIFFILSGVFIPDEFFQRAADELMFDGSEEMENPESITYWRKGRITSNKSFDVTLAASAGLGTILTAILSFRFGHGKLADWNRRFQEWIKRKKVVSVSLHESNVKNEGCISLFKSESKEKSHLSETDPETDSETDPLQDQFHETNETYLSCTDIDEIINVSTSENFRSVSETDPSQDQFETCSISTDIDEIINATTSDDSRTMVTNDEPRYKTLEARLVAVEGSLMRDIDSRMKIFEQQLEEFRRKLEDVTADFKRIKPKKGHKDIRFPILSRCGRGFDVMDDSSQTTSKENLSTVSGDVTAGDSSNLSSETGTELNSETSSTRKSRYTPKNKFSVQKSYTVNQIQKINKSESEIVQLEEVSAHFKTTKPKKGHKDIRFPILSRCGRGFDVMDDSSQTTSKENLSTVSGDVTAGDSSNLSSETGTELNSETGSTRKSRYTPKNKFSVQKSYTVNQIQKINKSESEIVQMMHQETSVKPLTPIDQSTSNKKNDIPLQNSPVRRGQPRSRQQMKDILQRTKKKLEQRATTKTANKI